MPDQSSAADEHALIQEITAPLANLPDDAMPLVADAHFPVALRGYDRIAVDAYVRKTSQLVAELQATRSPEAAVRRALERVGEQISGILQRAHDTSEQITAQSRREAEDRLQVARAEAETIRSASEQRVRELDAETDRIWAERHRIVDDARELAQQLLALAEEAAERFPAAEEPAPSAPAGTAPAADALPAPFDADADLGPDLLDREFTAEDPLEAPAEAQPRAPEAPAPTEPGPESVDLPFPFAGETLIEAEPEIDPEQTAVLPRFERRDSEVETQVQRKTEPPSGPSAS